MEIVMAETAKVFEDSQHPGEWRVEWFDNDDGCEVEIFLGPNAREQAIRYADHQYGKFEEVSIIRELTIEQGFHAN
jgi:hypothetical protein